MNAAYQNGTQNYVGKSVRNRQFEKSKSRWEDDIVTDLEAGLICLRQRPMAASCKHGNKTTCLLKRRKFTDHALFQASPAL